MFIHVAYRLSTCNARRETKCLSRMGVSIPEGAKMVLLQASPHVCVADREGEGRGRDSSATKPGSVVGILRPI